MLHVKFQLYLAEGEPYNCILCPTLRTDVTSETFQVYYISPSTGRSASFAFN